MYNSFFKTHSHNDSVQYIARIPTLGMGEVCTKMSIGRAHDYLLSFCETGDEVNIYVTSLTSYKPFTFGPIRTEARAVNHVKIVDNILMLVDNDDNPFVRAGGVYLYYLDFSSPSVYDMITMLDYLDYEDLQIEGFSGIGYIGSADIHRPMFTDEEYAIFLTEARSGNIFSFLFHPSANKQEAVYLQRKMI